MSTDNRPLSPHLQIYKWQWTMAYSIFHRATGIALAVGTIFLTWWLVALAMGPESFATVQAFAGSIIGRLVLFGWTWALFYHFGNGIRHLFWDSGAGFDLEVAEKTGHAMLAFSVIATVAVWVIAYASM